MEAGSGGAVFSLSFPPSLLCAPGGLLGAGMGRSGGHVGGTDHFLWPGNEES